MVLALAVALSACKVAGVDGKLTLGKTEADTQATLGSTVATPTSSTPRVIGPLAFEEAEAVYRDGRYSEATALFTAYLERKPANAWGHYMLGLSAWKAGETERAEAAFGKALELDAQHFKSWVNLSRVLLDAGRPDEALDAQGRALELDSTSAEVYRLIGRARYERGQVDDAIFAYRTAVTLDGQDAWAFNNLGVLYIEQGLPGDAIGALARAVDLRPEVAVFHNNLAMALERWGYFEAAQDQYALAVETDAGHRKAAANLKRIEGRGDRAGLPPLDLPTLAREFLEEVIRR
ncbi:MAG: tetratricopeptide repeat protein [Gemmatimonadetes bacterium]|nr:tetratricopeptide repeat protein [Gemmatimonadota bacterium]